MTDTVSIRLQLHGGLGPGPLATSTQDSKVVPVGTTLGAVLRQLGVEAGLVGVASSCGRHLKLTAVLDKDCEIDVYPIVGGG